MTDGYRRLPGVSPVMCDYGCLPAPDLKQHPFEEFVVSVLDLLNGVYDPFCEKDGPCDACDVPHVWKELDESRS